MNKHTPGPWEIMKNGDIGVIDKSDTQSFGMMLVICRVDSWDFKEAYDANVDLIAAAPELLEALTLILSLDDHDVWTDESWQVALNMARATIAKATGGK